MRLTTLLPHQRGLRVLNAAVSDDELTLDVEPIAASARCPSCQRRSRHIHSHYVRHITDHPIAAAVSSSIGASGGSAVTLWRARDALSLSSARVSRLATPGAACHWTGRCRTSA